MKLRVTTRVDASLEAVDAGFTKDLFERLNPPFPIARLKAYGGEHPGDLVKIELDFLLFKQLWVSEIIDREESTDEIYFTDVGKELPFFLKEWRHRHILKRDKATGGTFIIEDVDFQGPALLPNFLLYPALWGLFAYRKPIYRKVFRAQKQQQNTAEVAHSS